MSRRIEYYDDPEAPEPNSLVPASNMLVVNGDGEILLQRRRDTGQWALPGGVQDFGETPTQCAIRECREETGIEAEVVGIVGIYSDPKHIVYYTSDGETRQEWELTLLGRPIGGEPTINNEADDVRWFAIADLDQLDMHATMRRQIDHYLTGEYPHID